MRFKLDGNLPDELIADLRLAGHEADTAGDEGLVGASDTVVVAAALRERRILPTQDKRIVNLIEHPRSTHARVVLFRAGVTGCGEILRFIRSRLDELLSCELEDRVTVVSPRRIRGH